MDNNKPDPTDLPEEVEPESPPPVRRQGKRILHGCSRPASSPTGEGQVIHARSSSPERFRGRRHQTRNPRDAAARGPSGGGARRAESGRPDRGDDRGVRRVPWRHPPLPFKVMKIRVWDDLQKAFDDGTPVQERSSQR